MDLRTKYSLKRNIYQRIRNNIPARYRLWFKFRRQSWQIKRKSIFRTKTITPLFSPPTHTPITVTIVYTAMGAPTRYRVIHQAAQLEMAGFKTRLYSVDDLTAIDAFQNTHLLYLYRVELTPLTQQLIQYAQQHRIPVVFDTDDLIWDRCLEEFCTLRLHWPDQEVDDFLASVDRYRRIMQQVDYFILSTPYLAHLVATQFRQPNYVIKNALSIETQTIADTVLQNRRLKSFDTVTIAYFSGTLNTHEEDFQLITEPLTRILQKHPQVVLKIVGHLKTNDLFVNCGNRVQYYSFVEWSKMFEILSQVDINLAPLVDNPHRRCKSAVKFMEAGLVEVPTVASNLDPYQDIQHGQTGFLASTPGEWYDCLTNLIVSPKLRLEIGAAARKQVLALDTVQVRSSQLKETIQQILEDYYNN